MASKKDRKLLEAAIAATKTHVPLPVTEKQLARLRKLGVDVDNPNFHYHLTAGNETHHQWKALGEHEGVCEKCGLVRRRKPSPYADAKDWRYYSSPESADAGGRG